MCKQRPSWAFGLNVIALFSAGLAFGQMPGADSAERMVGGLWEYTGLVSSAGNDMPLTGVFLFKDGIFLQQAIFEGEPFDEQGAMAHAGPYTSESDSVHLIAEQTISISPDQAPSLSFRQNTEHDLSVSRSGDRLTLVFGSGTVQEFKYIGPGKGEVYALQDGALAFVDGYFILVQGDAEGSVSGYGSFDKDGENLQLKVKRWAEADDTRTVNRRDAEMRATFDGHTLTLADGRSFTVAPRRAQ